MINTTTGKNSATHYHQQKINFAFFSVLFAFFSVLVEANIVITDTIIIDGAETIFFNAYSYQNNITYQFNHFVNALHY